MKKLLIGLGIGCGVLVMIGVIAFVVLGYFGYQKGKALKDTASAKLESMQKTGVEMKAQEEALKQLDREFPFTPPAQGELMKLDETRLQDYIAIRKEALPVYKQYDEMAKSFDARTRKGKDMGVGDVMEGMGMVSDFMMKLRTTFIGSLRTHRMSPLEFHTTTATVYSTYMHKGMQAAGKATDEAREKIQKEMGELNDRMNEPGLTEDAKTAIQNSLDELQKTLDNLPQSTGDSGANGNTDANAALLEKYKADIEAAANPGFDLFIASEDASKAFAGAFSAPSR